MSCSEYEYETDSGCLSVKVRMKEEVIIGRGTQHLGEAAARGGETHGNPALRWSRRPEKVAPPCQVRGNDFEKRSSTSCSGQWWLNSQEPLPLFLSDVAPVPEGTRGRPP